MAIPTWCMVPITVSIVIGGVLYAIVMGAITGYFSAAVGMLFVISGIIGILSAAFSRKALAVFVCINNFLFFLWYQLSFHFSS